MKVGILAGGQGTRFAEETYLRPKPMIEIGGRPILWHIMKHYAHYGHKDFVIALGYKGEYIKKFFLEYRDLTSNLSINLGNGDIKASGGENLDWTVELVDTGVSTNTGGRIKRIIPYMGNETFMMTWGDGVSDIDLTDLLAYHRHHGKLVTVTSVPAPTRFGYMHFDGDMVTAFQEKPQGMDGWINAAFFVMEPGVYDYIDNDDTAWELQPMQRLAADGQLMAYRHNSFWKCMDTQRDKQQLQAMWESESVPWRVWE